MSTKTVSIDVFNPIGVTKIEPVAGTQKMAKYRKRKPFKLSMPKAILWFAILSVAVGFAFLWYKLISFFLTLF
ncbi:hypothetical protein [Larkinella rosea]|uniref:Uncharacterized protein n=1 Tax=Larkinella rosea TaxID=2025312 RepID=A0A3P1BQ68_9BACT|nr:hypothetical protein [Larkinella rosea]RRB02814.1 hypothetical protein EHT25_20460 [Larkinella rosea]